MERGERDPAELRWWEDDSWTDLGHGCAYKPYGIESDPMLYAAGDRVGIFFRHKCDDPWEHSATPEYCIGSVMFRPRYSGEPTWTVESEEPLTISPSVLCTKHNVHGFIRNGRWEPC